MLNGTNRSQDVSLLIKILVRNFTQTWSIDYENDVSSILWCYSRLLEERSVFHNRINNAINWCNNNCQDKYKDSNLSPWVFLSEDDAKKFSVEFGGEVRYKPEEWK